MEANIKGKTMKTSPFVCGGPVRLDSEVYISREVEMEAFNAIQNKDYISIFGPRQIGKTSFLHRIQALVESKYNHATALIDLSSINDPDVTFKEWSHQLCQLINDQVQPFIGRNKAVGFPKDFVGFRTFWGKLAQNISRPSILILLDEANSVPIKINDPFYSTIRSIYGNKRSYRPDENLSKINFAFAGVFEPEKLVLNRENSPFNVSKKIRLGDFSEKELSVLTNIFYENLGVKISEGWIFKWTNGHPYLSQVLLDLVFKYVISSNISKVNENTISELIPKLLDETSDNIDHTIKLVLNDQDKYNKLTQLLRDDKISFSRASRLTAQLELDGIIKDDGSGKIMIRNRLYEESLKKVLDMPVTNTFNNKTLRTEIFISYSHADDEKYIKKLHVHLDPLKRKNKIVLWDDTMIKPGQKWREEIQSALNRAKIAILMVSPDFLASPFVNDNELPKILGAAEKDGLTIVWIPVSSSAYRDTVIEPYQAVINPGKPLDKMNSGELNDALLKVYEAIKQVVEQ
jgi:predicted nucleotide-binding protein